MLKVITANDNTVIPHSAAFRIYPLVHSISLFRRMKRAFQFTADSTADLLAVVAKPQTFQGTECLKFTLLISLSKRLWVSNTHR